MLSAPRGGVLFFTATSENFCASRDGRRDATGGRVDGADTRWRASRRGSARSDAGENASFVSTARRAKRVAPLVARRDRVAPFAPIWCTRWRGDGRNPVTRRHRRASRHRDHAVNASQKYSPSDFSRFPRGAVPATDSTASTIERFAQRCAKGIACDYSTRSHCLQTPRVI